MRKLARGAPVDTEANLLAFLGVPSNFRNAMSTSVKYVKKHSLEHMLSFPPPRAIYSLAQHTEGDRDAMEKISTQVVVSLKAAQSIPKPDDSREQDVLSRQVRVCLLDANDAIMGNVHTVSVTWKPEEEDVWHFRDYKFLVRTHFPKQEASLLIEFVLKLSNNREPSKRVQRRLNKNNVKTPPPVEMTCGWCKISLDKLISDTEPVRLNQVLSGGTVHAPVAIDEVRIQHAFS